MNKQYEGHTPGPWRWELNENSKTVHVVGGKPMFDKTVMGFTRWGMGNAAPMFNDAIAGNEYNILERVEEYGAEVPGREHHADWFKDVNHPDAQLMAAAPELLQENAELKSLIDRFLIEWDDEQGDRCLLDDAVDALRNIRKVGP